MKFIDKIVEWCNFLDQITEKKTQVMNYRNFCIDG